MIIWQPAARLFAWLGAYAAHEDPLVASANLVALVVAGNVPFYPVYYFILLGADGWPSLCTLFAGPLFFAVPWVSRRSTLVGRALPTVIGTANTIFCTKIMGEASGNALYLVPCVMVAAQSFRAGERWVMLALVWLPTAAFLISLDRLGAPLIAFTEAQSLAMLRLNIVSVSIFAGFLGMVYGRSRVGR